MPRALRTVEPDLAHHVTQRGVDRQPVFFSTADRVTYLNLVAENQHDAGVSVLAYCLMTNHVHWVVTPERPDSLSILFRRVHGRYAQYLNARRGRTGHLWQNRFFCCPLAGRALWTAIRYVELNPVRAGLAGDAASYRWSTATAHLAGPQSSSAIAEVDWQFWKAAGGSEAWRVLLDGRDSLSEVVELRRCTYSGKPFGSPDFLEHMEAKYGRRWKNKGRPRKEAKSEKEAEQTGTFLKTQKRVCSG